MPRVLPLETVTAGSSSTVSAGARGTVSTVVLYNESGTLLQVSWGGSSHYLPAWTGDRFDMGYDPGFTGAFTLTSTAIANSGNAPSSVVAGVAFAPGDLVPGTYPVALVRQANVGNGSLPVTSAQSVINDGNAAGDTVVEATQSGQTNSSLKLLNDGTALLAPLSLGALLSALVVTPGSGVAPATGSFGDSAHPTNWALHGVADQVPATGVQAGALGAGVTLPATQLTSGAVPAGVTVPATQITAGALAVGVTTPITNVGNGTSSFTNGSISSGSIITRWESFGGNILVSGRDIIAGASTGTFSHRVGTTPYMCLPVCHVTNSSETVGYDSETSTTVHVTAGGGLSWRADLYG